MAAENQRTLLVPYGWNYKPFSQEAKRLMDEGAVGDVEYALCHMASPTKEFFGAGGSVEVSRNGSRRSPRPNPRRGRSRSTAAGTGTGR